MIRMEDTEFCFVASHLAAHQEKVEDRNDNVVEIIKGLDISTKGMDFVSVAIWLAAVSIVPCCVAYG